MFKIKERLRPFSHLPKSAALIPGTKIEVRGFPTRVEIGDKVTTFDVKGPLKEFTFCVDLERRCIFLFSEKYKWYIWPNGELKKQRPPVLSTERLFLGSTKKQEWENIKKRCDMREIFPIWFQLGQLISAKGSFSLIEHCTLAISKHRPEKIIPAFRNLFLAAFRDIMIPRLQDDDYQGITKDVVQGDPLVILSEGARLIRMLFIDGEKILPNLPPECVSGKFCGLEESYGTVDLEWTKKRIRRVVIRAKEDRLLHLQFPRAIRSFRVNKEAGRLPIAIKSGMVYVLDRFKK